MNKQDTKIAVLLALVLLLVITAAIITTRPPTVVLTAEPEKTAFQIDTSKLDFSGITKKMESIERVTKAISNPLRISWGKRV